MAEWEQQGWSAMRVLAEPTRRRIFQAVRASGPLTRDTVAEEVGISRALAAFHLDALAAAGLLEVDFARPAGRTGPGAGRPAKRYRPVGSDIDVSVPPRRYELAATILLAGVRDAGRGQVRQATLRAAADKGRAVARDWSGTEGSQRVRARAVLDDLGYEPADEQNRIRLRNCPFHALVANEPELVCGINHRFLDALVNELGLADVVTRFEPTPGECCVHLAVPAAEGDRA